MPSWSSDFEESSFPSVPMRIVFDYQSTLAIHSKRRRSFIHITLAKHCDLALLSLFTPTPVGGSVDYIHVLDRFTALTESDILVPLASDVHFSVAVVGLFSRF